jgi:hypothetical protein
MRTGPHRDLSECPILPIGKRSATTPIWRGGKTRRGPLAVGPFKSLVGLSSSSATRGQGVATSRFRLR